MDDQNMGEVSQAAVDPATDAPTSGSVNEVVDQQPTEAQSTEAETVTNEVGDIPKDNAAWAAMRTENKRLKEVLEDVDPEYLNKLRGATTPQEPMYQQFTPVSDDADYSEVTNRLNFTQQQAIRANEQLARMQQQMELQQDRMAEDAYPELKTDKVFQQIVAEKKLAARVLGHDKTTMEIAREVSKLLSRREEQVAVQTAQATKQEMLDKQAATAEAKGQSSAARYALDDESLRNRVRKGDSDAQTQVAKRLIADLEF
jgi:hypothetical protein